MNEEEWKAFWTFEFEGVAIEFEMTADGNAIGFRDWDDKKIGFALNEDVLAQIDDGLSLRKLSLFFSELIKHRRELERLEELFD